MINKSFKKIILLISSFCMLLSPVYSHAGELNYMEQNLSMPVKSNSVENWPIGPAVSSYSAVLMDGTLVYLQ